MYGIPFWLFIFLQGVADAKPALCRPVVESLTGVSDCEEWIFREEGLITTVERHPQTRAVDVVIGEADKNAALKFGPFRIAAPLVLLAWGRPIAHVAADDALTVTSCEDMDCTHREFLREEIVGPTGRAIPPSPADDACSTLTIATSQLDGPLKIYDALLIAFPDVHVRFRETHGVLGGPAAQLFTVSGKRRDLVEAARIIRGARSP